MAVAAQPPHAATYSRMPGRADRVRLAVAALALFAAIATIATAWAFQLWGGYIPCKLCLQERIPYYVGIPIAAVALLAAMAGNARLARLLLLVVAVVFLVGFGLGLYHAGVEWKWWLGPADCGAGAAPSSRVAGDLLGQLTRFRIVSCTEATWRFIGLSFAGWNAVASFGIAAVAMIGAAATARRWRPATHRG